ncbi:MAG: PAS domain-containing protein [Deltaproteobacteria bacterium]|nr:PAS domain-containing protein [Deltaproteobacteria bacterium]MBW2531083.1 PAS domain-containing protein [Deltaproteobacteria bacterium]
MARGSGGPGERPWLAPTFDAALGDSASSFTVYDRDATVLWLSPTARAPFGDLVDLIIGRPLRELLPTMHDVTVERCRRTIDHGEVFEVEDALDLGGQRRWFRSVFQPLTDAEGERVAAQVLSFDITTLKEAEEQLELHRLVVESTAELVAIVDRDLRCRMVSPSWCALRGVSQDAVIGVHLRSLVGEKLAATLEPLFERVFAGEAITRDHQLDDHTGRTRDLSTRLQPAEPHALAVTIDVTDRLELERQIAHASKTESLGRLAGGIAHDFNNQLLGILGYAELLQMTTDDPRLTPYVEGILAAGRRSADMTKQLLAFARRGPRRKEEVDLHALIGEVLGVLRHAIDASIVVERRLDAEDHCTVGDGDQLQNVLLNLTLNARDAMRDGGRLAVSTANGHDGSTIEIRVADTGVGMSVEVSEKIFEPFFTTKGRGEGTGMGLAMAHGVVTRHGGRIEVASEVGRGTCFTVVLPLTVPRSREVLPSRNDLVRVSARVVVCDDDASVRELLCEALDRLGHSPVPVAGGREALHVLDEEPGADVLLLDLAMPGMRGEEVLAVLHERQQEIPVVVLSGHGKGERGEALLRDLGAAAFLNKPVELKHLGRVLEDVLSRSSRRVDRTAG